MFSNMNQSVDLSFRVDLGLCWLHMMEEAFLFGVAHKYFLLVATKQRCSSQ